MVERRYLRNLNMLSEAEMGKLAAARVAVVGCGGLGGYVLELVGRLGVGQLTAIDGDVFDETNLNRQLLSDLETLGQSKAEAARARMLKVNPLVNVSAIAREVTAANGTELLAGHDVVVDAVDSIATRLVLQALAARLGVPLVHGAIAGWYGQVTTVFPEDRTLDAVYGGGSSGGIERELGNPSFTPALVASVQAGEVLKLLIGRGEVLRKRILYIDLLEHFYTVIAI
ncbi:MAG TPA: molybdopterin biosynthesis protein MoeB [Clostridiales bacterium UBA8153]|nr:molybdopterin biosynthesis protein MoeB [Clostridiales bacterium UBA8153]